MLFAIKRYVNSAIISILDREDFLKMFWCAIEVDWTNRLRKIKIKITMYVQDYFWQILQKWKHGKNFRDKKMLDFHKIHCWLYEDNEKVFSATLGFKNKIQLKVYFTHPLKKRRIYWPVSTRPAYQTTTKVVKNCM